MRKKWRTCWISFNLLLYSSHFSFIPRNLHLFISFFSRFFFVIEINQYKKQFETAKYPSFSFKYRLYFLEHFHQLVIFIYELWIWNVITEFLYRNSLNGLRSICMCVVYINMEMRFLTTRDESETESNIVQSIS